MKSTSIPSKQVKRAATPFRKPLTLASLLGGPAKQENWLNETLDCDTSTENNTSVILAVKLRDSYWAMFTGDAGEPALLGALDWLDYTNFSTSNFKFVQIPHHGSEHNISPAVLDRWLGSPQLFDRKSRTIEHQQALGADSLASTALTMGIDWALSSRAESKIYTV